MARPGAYLPLGDDDLYQNNLTPNPSPAAPLPTRPLLSCLGNDSRAPIPTPSPSPGPVPAPILPTILRLKVADLAAISRIDETLDKKQKNWTGWAESMYVLFGCANAKGYVEGRIPCPDPSFDPVGADNWEFNDSYTRMLINKNIASSEKVHTCGCANAHKMWNNLKTIHKSTCYLIHTDRIRILCGIKVAEGADIPEHLTKLKHQWEQISFSGKLKKIYNNNFFKQQIAASLPRSWDQFTSPYVRKYEDDDQANIDPKRRIDSQQLIGIIGQEYELQESRKREEITLPPKGENANPSLASRMSDPPSKAKSKKSGKRHCKHCGKNGHYTDQCRNIGKNKCRLCDGYGHNADECKKDNDQSQNGKRKYKNNGSSSNKRSRNDAQSADDTTQQSALHGQLVALNADNGAGAKAYDDYNSYNSYENVSSDSEFNDGQAYDWLADTGTTSHITHQRDAFATYESIPKVPISGVGGVETFAIGRGTVFLLSRCDGYMNVLQLNNVLHVPSNRNSLLSLGNWEENDRSIHAHKGILRLTSSEGKDIARGRKIVNKLYMMSFRLMDQSAPANVAFNAAYIATDPTPSWETWHRRYGHVGYPGLQTLLDRHMVDGLNVNLLTPKPDCIACIEAKIHEAPYGPTTKKFTKPGELTHIDLWGKYDVASIHSNSYYLLMVDDASRYITVEFLKTKSEATARIKEYLAYLTARNKTPCALRMDRGTEFVNEELRTWCHS